MSTLSSRVRRALPRPFPRHPPTAFQVPTLWTRQFSTFEKVIVANSAIIVLDTLAGWWITQHNPETYHYVIDTGFIALATLLSLAVNFALLRAAFAPLHGVLATIRAVEHGDLEARVAARPSDADVLVLARAFNGMLDKLQEARDEVAARVLQAQEDERRRIALELHDQTGQSLTALALHAKAIAQRLAAEQSVAAEQSRAQAERLATLAEQTLAEVQALAHQLRPAVLDDLGLDAALRWLAEDARDRLQVEVTTRIVRSEHERGRLPSEVETALFRIAQESITNAVRHGHARYVRLVLRQARATVRVTVADDGQGFAVVNGVAGHACTEGQGLEGMRERARLAGGSLRIRSQPERGCVVHAAVPLTRSAAEGARAFLGAMTGVGEGEAEHAADGGQSR